MSAKRICIEKDQQISDIGDKDPQVVINSLDYDSLAKIIMWLPIPERIDMEKVCIKWKEACQIAWYDIKEYKCKSTIGRCYDNCLLTQSYLEEILSRCGSYLKELSLSDVCNSQIMPFIGDHCKNLTTLECKFNDIFVIDNADNFVQAFTQLDKLKCIRIIMTSDNYPRRITFHPFEIINSLPEKIIQIHLISQHWIWLKKKVSISVKKFKNLRELTLHGDRFLDGMILQEIAEKTTLVYLNIQQYDITKSSFLFDKLVNLEYINLTPTYGTSGALINELYTKLHNTILYTCKNLKHLDMAPGLYDIAKIPRNKLINFQNLEYLGISCNIMPDLANTIVKYCKNLKHLRIHHSFPNLIIINDTAFKKLTELENLECLKLDRLIKLYEGSIIAISNNCKKLKRLEILDCTIVSSIDGEPLLSPSVFDELSKLQYLEHLNFRYANNLKDSTIIAIANNCKNLKSLDIGYCKAITETALVALTNLKNLQKLNVSLLNIITDDSFLIKLKGLKELDCSFCCKLTNSGIIQIINNNPDLKKINVWCINNITIDLVIAADQATKSRTNGIILQLIISGSVIKPSSIKPIIESPWLVVKYW